MKTIRKRAFYVGTVLGLFAYVGLILIAENIEDSVDGGTDGERDEGLPWVEVSASLSRPFTNRVDGLYLGVRVKNLGSAGFDIGQYSAHQIRVGASDGDKVRDFSHI